MHRHLPLVLVLALLEGLACSGTASTDGGSGGGRAAGGGPATGGGSAAGGGAPDCGTYCTTIAGACTGTSSQWPSAPACLTECAAWPAGTSSDSSGNTLGCRLKHAQAAAADAGACAAAGPSGGDEVVSDELPGACGEGCDAFCDVAQAVCTMGNSQFADRPACLTACKTFKASSGPYNTGDQGNNDFGCRVYHLSAASQGAAAAVTHCPHIAAVSAVCKN